MSTPNIIISKYHSDTGNWDLNCQEMIKLNTDFDDILDRAIELMITNYSDVCIIIKTSYKSPQKPGHWYIKGYDGTFTYKKIKDKIKINVANNKYSKRECYLIKINY